MSSIDSLLQEDNFPEPVYNPYFMTDRLFSEKVYSVEERQTMKDLLSFSTDDLKLIVKKLVSGELKDKINGVLVSDVEKVVASYGEQQKEWYTHGVGLMLDISELFIGTDSATTNYVVDSKCNSCDEQLESAISNFYDDIFPELDLFHEGIIALAHLPPCDDHGYNSLTYSSRVELVPESDEGLVHLSTRRKQESSMSFKMACLAYGAGTLDQVAKDPKLKQIEDVIGISLVVDGENVTVEDAKRRVESLFPRMESNDDYVGAYLDIRNGKVWKNLEIDESSGRGWQGSKAKIKVNSPNEDNPKADLRDVIYEIQIQDKESYDLGQADHSDFKMRKLAYLDEKIKFDLLERADVLHDLFFYIAATRNTPVDEGSVETPLRFVYENFPLILKTEGIRNKYLFMDVD